jgi:hypothetical protein
MPFLSPGPAVSDAERIAQEQGRAPMHQAGKAYTNYRQFSRDNSQNQLSNQSSIYQGMMNRLASAYGEQGVPNVEQMRNNPMSARQTMVGSVTGSNAAGWGQGDPQFNGHKLGDNNWGMIGQMGAVNQGDVGGYEAIHHGPATMQTNGQPIAPGGSINNISARNGYAPQPVAQSGAPQGGFSFAPRRV